ncbi:MAG: hypothetical protein ACM3S2_11935 [Ignavibacteriales bacterium]
MVLIFIGLLYSHGFSQDEVDTSLINTSHLDKLYDRVNIDGKEMAIIHIYAEAPDYNWTDAPGEGTACVDDVARAAIFYLRYLKATNNVVFLTKAKLLLEFLFYMQAENGLFYNFINSDHTINKEGRNSRPLPDWWSWRALWAMGEAYSYFYDTDKELAKRLQKSLTSGFNSLRPLINNYPETTNLKGFRLPTWLPYQYASDQAAVIVMALVPFYLVSRDTLIEQYIRKISSGIIMMQAGDSLKFPFGAHLSWENTWHAWGSNQSEALLLAGDALKDKELISSARKEVDHFYDFLMERNYMNEFSVADNKEENSSRFPQIAYGIDPMVSACLLAGKIIPDPLLAEKGAAIACWFLGKNAAGKPMYDEKTGRCYDGIVSEGKINYNSGAESTIEALLALLAVESNPQARKILKEYYTDHKKSK